MMKKKAAPLGDGFAVISDIHGNLNALECVFEELDRRNIKTVFALGDHVWGGQGFETWQLLQQRETICLKGASETAVEHWHRSGLGSVSASTEEQELFATGVAGLGDVLIEKLSRLKTQLRVPLISGGEALFIHGSMRDALDEVDPHASDEEIRDAINDDLADLVFVGASHIPFRRKLEDGPLVVGVGSVGQSPEGAHAHFTLVHPYLERIDVMQEWVAVPVKN